MSGKIRPCRFAHCEGHTSVTYSNDGKYIITGGSDGDVRLFQGVDDDDCLSHPIAEKVYALAHKSPNIIVALDNNCVQYVNAFDGVPGQVVTRFTSYPTCIDMCGKLIAAGSSDMTVRVHDTEDFKDVQFEGHSAPVLSVALDPKGEYVASSSCDGSVRIWSILLQSCIKTLWDVLPHSNQFRSSQSLCKLVFTPSGSHLLVPHGNKIISYNRSSWDKVKELENTNSSATVSLLAINSSMQLAASSTDGYITVYDLKTGTQIVSVQHPKKINITGLSWHPRLLELALVDSNGALATVVDIGKTTATESNHTTVPDPSSAQNNIAIDDGTIGEDDALAQLNDFPMDDDDNDISLAKIKNDLGFADDEHGTFIGLPQKDTTQSASEAPEARASPMRTITPAPVVQLPELQRTFTPTMTPEHHAQRYMLWNDVGIVKQYSSDVEASISVDFHDSSVHHSIHQPNSSPSYSIAALSHKALVLGAEQASDSPSRVSVQVLSGSPSDTSQDWSVELPDGEDVTALAVGTSFIAIASDNRILRLMSIGGCCKEVLSVPGPLVCLSAHKDTLMVLYHNGMGGSGDQAISMLLLNTRRPSLAPNVSVALCPKSYVSWAGFTDEGTPAVADSLGYVRLLLSNNTWAVLINTKEKVKGCSDHHFILGINEEEAKIRTIMCRGSRYPPLIPPPYVSMLDFSAPVFEAHSEKGALHSSLITSRRQLSTFRRIDGRERDMEAPLQEVESSLQMTLIKLFALACQSGKELRALDLCELMEERTVQSAVKYAAKVGKMDLAESISDRMVEITRQRQLEKEEVAESSSSGAMMALRTQDYTEYSEDVLPPGDLSLINSNSNSGQEESMSSSSFVNPLIAAQNKKTSFLDLTMSPSSVNPFKKSISLPDPNKKGIKILDDYKPKTQSSTVIMRPTLKKKSKAQRSLNKSGNSQQQLTLNSSIRSTADTTAQLTPSIDENTPSDSSTTSPPSLIDSGFFKKTIAMHLWWADNEELVRENNTSTNDLKMLVPTAAVLFKNQTEDVKNRYKRLAAAAGSDSNKPAGGVLQESSSNTDGGRKRELPSQEDDQSNTKKQKCGSGLSKLAAFACSKE